jgi:type II restriction enzyme
MWANFGPAVQVKHLTLDPTLAEHIVDQIESDHIVIVCKDADAEVIETITKQIGWGKRVRGIVRESDLVNWYEKCLRGKFSAELGQVLLTQLSNGFRAEFPHNTQVLDLMKERKYTEVIPAPLWQAITDKVVAPRP